MRPGRVIEVLGSGNVKVSAPGLFAEEDKENLPTVMPFFGLHANSYSEPKIQDEVWVLNVEDNPLQLFWFRKDDHTEHNADLEGEENVEILVNREAGTGYATIYFSNGTGWMFRNGDSFINIMSDGSILIDPNMDNRIIHCCGNSISLGSKGGSAHKAGYGDEIRKALDMIQSCLSSVRQAALMNPYTKNVADAIGSTPENLKTQITKTVSTNVTLD